jgi:hypothetical protein
MGLRVRRTRRHGLPNITIGSRGLAEAVTRSTATASAASGRPGERAPLLAEIVRDFRKIHRVQDPVRWHTALARHLNTPVHVVELGDRVRVRIDADRLTAWKVLARKRRAGSAV